MWLEIVLLVPVLCYVLHLWAFSYWKRRGVFQVDGSIIFGNIKDILFMKRSIDDVMADIYKKHKDRKLVGIYSFYRPLLVVTEPELIRRVMVTDFNSFSLPAAEIDPNIDHVFGMNPFATHDHKLWKERRGHLMAVSTPSKLKSLPELTVRIGRNMIGFIKEHNEAPIKVSEISELFAMDAVCIFMFGYEPTAFTDEECPFRKYGRQTLFTPELGKSLNSAMLFPTLARIFSYRIVTKESQEFFLTLCKQLMEFRKKNPSTKYDLIDQLIKTNVKLQQEGKPELSNKEIEASSLAAYIDSYFTTSSGLSYLIWELSKNPEIQEKLRSEILAVGSKMEDFDYDKINSLQYLNMATTENLRLHPPVFVSGRTCSKTTELEGIKIEKGTKVLLPFFCFHKDPNYFSEPEKFIPERFKSEESIAKGTVMPFGDGPRMCPGSRYATTVMKIVILYLLLNFRILPHAEEGAKAKRTFALDHADDTMKAIFHPIDNFNK